MADIPWLACMLAVSQFYHLPPRVLPSIQRVEGGHPGVVSHNRNGTGDLGVMQVNSMWVPRIADSWSLPRHDVARRLVHDPCFNIAVAGAIMRIYLNESNGDIVRAVGYYHSHTPWLAGPYQWKVIHAASTLFEPTPRTRPAVHRHARVIPSRRSRSPT